MTAGSRAVAGVPVGEAEAVGAILERLTGNRRQIDEEMSALPEGGTVRTSRTARRAGSTRGRTRCVCEPHVEPRRGVPAAAIASSAGSSIASAAAPTLRSARRSGSRRAGARIAASRRASVAIGCATRAAISATSVSGGSSSTRSGTRAIALRARTGASGNASSGISLDGQMAGP